MKLTKNKRDTLREMADGEWDLSGAEIRTLLDALDEAEAEIGRLHEMLGWISRKTTEGEIFGAIEHLRWHLANPTTEECQHG